VTLALGFLARSPARPLAFGGFSVVATLPILAADRFASVSTQAPLTLINISSKMINVKRQFEDSSIKVIFDVPVE
jgi:hypothetical protein